MTTIKLGATRYGPLAPETRQLGKYDTFTRTGTPTLSTLNDTELSLDAMWSTCTGCSTVRGGSVAMGATRAHALGPAAAYSTSERFWSRYQASEASSHGLPPLAMPLITTGWL